MEHVDLLRYTCQTLEMLNVAYIVTGSTATIAYGEPRFTNDIDIVVDLPSEKVAAFCAAFPLGEYYLSEEGVRNAVRAKHLFNVLHPSSGLKIDFILFTDSEFDQARRKRGRNVGGLSNEHINFASPEDVIIKKMLYYREGGSEKHLRDIAGVVRIQGAFSRSPVASADEALCRGGTHAVFTIAKGERLNNTIVSVSSFILLSLL